MAEHEIKINPRYDAEAKSRVTYPPIPTSGKSKHAPMPDNYLRGVPVPRLTPDHA